MAGVVAVSGCNAAVVEGAAVEVDLVPMVLAAATTAVEVPAAWFVSADPALGLTAAAHASCLEGHLEGVPLLFNVVQVTPDGVWFAGEGLVGLEQGRLAPTSSTRALRQRLQTVAEMNAQVAEAGCRPWQAGDPRFPADLGSGDQPALLLAVDARVPLETLGWVLGSCPGVDRFPVALLVDDPDPAPWAAGRLSIPDEGHELTVELDDEGLSWAYLPVSDGPERWVAVEQAGQRAPLQQTCDLAREVGASLPPHSPLPRGLARLRSGAAGDGIGVLDQLRELDTVCARLWILPDAPAEHARDGELPGDAEPARTLSAGDTVSVLGLSTAAGWFDGFEHERLVSGERCPTADPLDDLWLPGRDEGLRSPRVQALRLVFEATGEVTDDALLRRVVDDLAAIGEQYPAVAGVPVRWRPSHRDFDTCLLVDGTTHLYLMIEGGGDCPAGCTEMTYRGFETAAAGQVTFLGSSVQGQDGFAGITSDRDISACTKWLSPRWDRFVAGPGSAGRNPDPLPAAADTRLTVVQFEATPPLPRMELERQRFTDHAREIAKCRAARTTGPPHGDVHVTLVVDAKSRTTTVTSLDSPWQEQLVHDCLASVLHRWVPEDVEERTTVTSTSRFGIPEGAR